MAPFTLEINFEIYVKYCLSRKISSVNRQLSKEINFKILFRNLEHVLFCEILRSAVIGQSAVFTNIDEASSMMFTSGFQKYFQCEKYSLSKEKFQNFSFEMEFRN